MLVLNRTSFDSMEHALTVSLLNATSVDVGEWHAQSTEGNPLLVTKELQDVILEIAVPRQMTEAQDVFRPNLPWAEAHFQERLDPDCPNPPPSHELWPWAHATHQKGEQGEFSHTYPERYWPKFANVGETRPNGRQVFVPHNGIRYEYGDLGDLVAMLRRNGNTRQAYLPVWFPEDTGATHGERVPCSLGYHFLIREGRLSCRYYLRSCDFVRHFRDDVYLTARLMQWLTEQLPGVTVGRLNMYISSLHIMSGDEFKLKRELASAKG